MGRVYCGKQATGCEVESELGSSGAETGFLESGVQVVNVGVGGDLDLWGHRW